MVLYDETNVNDLSKRYIKYLICVIVIFALTIIPCFVVYFIVDDNSIYSILKTTFIIVMLLSGWVAITIITIYMSPIVRRKKLIKKIMSFEKREIVGEVVKMDTTLTVAEKIEVTEIIVLKDNKQFSFYYDKGCTVPDFVVGDKVAFLLSANFVYSYEVVK